MLREARWCVGGFVCWRTGPGNKVSSSLHDSQPGGPAPLQGLGVQALLDWYKYPCHPSHSSVQLTPLACKQQTKMKSVVSITSRQIFSSPQYHIFRPLPLSACSQLLLLKLTPSQRLRLMLTTVTIMDMDWPTMGTDMPTTDTMGKF